MSIPTVLRQLTAERDRHRCVYRQTSQENSGQRLQIDHIVPRSHDGQTAIDNLCLACSSFNSHKQAQQAYTDPQTGDTVLLFHPLQQAWNEHPAWDESNTLIAGLTACGRATIAALNMNNSAVVWARRRWVEAGWHPPQ